MTAEASIWTLPDAPPMEPTGGPQVSDDPSFVPPPPPAAPPARRRPRGSRAVAALALVLAGGVVGGAVGATVTRNDARSTSVASAPTTPAVQAASTGGGLDVGSVLAAIEPAVVDIQATSLRGSGQGTGIVYSGDGLVLTNAHVVAGATRVTVTTATDRTARSAQVLGSDPTHDIALVKIDDPSNLVVAKLGDSKSVRVGADVVAIGNALGLRGDPSVTRGIVSALDRSIGDLTGMLQTDAAINPGNSGGPLVNANGEVIGINTAIAVEDGAQNIGFAIPIDAARTIAERLRSGAPAAPGGFLGVSTRDAETATTGAEVVAVTSGSPASDAGIQPGDVIVAVDSTAITGAADLSRIVGDHQPGDGIDITVVRNGQEKHMTAKLGSK